MKVNAPIDGKNIWDALSLDKTSPRNEVLCHLDDSAGFSSYIRDQWKYVNGSTYNGLYDDWLSNIDSNEMYPEYKTYGQAILSSETGRALYPYTSNLKNALSATDIEDLRSEKIINCNGVVLDSNDNKYECNPMRNPCLFNIISDPCERKNLANLRPNTLKMMENNLDKFRKVAVPPRNKASDPNSNPKYFNNTWTWWYDELGMEDHSNSISLNVNGIKCWFVIISGIIHYNYYYC